jgi:hypothetical protein
MRVTASALIPSHVPFLLVMSVFSWVMLSWYDMDLCLRIADVMEDD